MRTSTAKIPPVVTFLLCLVLAPIAASAGDLAQPSGKVILSVSGNIANTNSGDKALFDRAMLEALGVDELTVETAWTDGRPTFSGIRGSKILDAVGASGSVIVARAINDYKVEIPLAEIRKYPVLFALKQDGRYMRVRDKGPIWIIYPRETYPELDTEQYKDRWIWQLESIHVK